MQSSALTVELVTNPAISSITATALGCGVTPDIARRAADNVVSKRVSGLLLSGRQGAGKDTVAPLVMERLEIPAVQVRVSQAIRAEMDIAIAYVSSHSRPNAADLIAADLGLDVVHAAALVDVLWDATRAPGHGVTAYSRTAEVRRALQYHGLESRVASDPTYWVRACFKCVVEHLAEGTSVFLTDSRFPNEVDTARALGMFSVRLVVDPLVQTARITARDGAPPDLATLEHPGERVLDAYTGFDLVIDNSNDVDTTVTAVAEQFATFLHASV